MKRILGIAAGVTVYVIGLLAVRAIVGPVDSRTFFMAVLVGVIAATTMIVVAPHE